MDKIKNALEKKVVISLGMLVGAAVLIELTFQSNNNFAQLIGRIIVYGGIYSLYAKTISPKETTSE